MWKNVLLSKFYYTNMFVIIFAGKISFPEYIFFFKKRFKRFKGKNVWYKYLVCGLKI